MIVVPSLAKKTVAVFGLAKSGLSAARVLQASGAHVLAWDDDAARREDAARLGITLHDLASESFAGAGALVLSPGIPHTYPQPHPVVRRARETHCPVIGDMELMARAALPGRFVGVTGTNGKSTTTALIGHILKQAGKDARTGGNIGTPCLDLGAGTRATLYVLEVSSFQLELIETLSFDIAVLLNITPDHIDRHGTMENYVAAKKRLFARQNSHQAAILGVDDDYGRALFAELKEQSPALLIPVSAQGPVAGGVYAENGFLVDDIGGRAEKILSLGDLPRLPGRHNAQNVAAAHAAARAAGLASAQIVEGLKSFPGLPHRQENVGIIGAVSYINDSKATNAQAASVALECYRNVYWIAGGKPKSDGIDPLGPWFDRIRHAFLIGEASQRFARTLENHVPYTLCGDLARATKEAHTLAQKETAAAKDKAVVLLSPACASFDQWKNFEERGDAFRAMVRDLIAHNGAAPSCCCAAGGCA